MNKSQEIIRYVFLNEWLETASKEDIVQKLIENDERGNLILEMQKQMDDLLKHVKKLTTEINEFLNVIEGKTNENN